MMNYNFCNNNMQRPPGPWPTLPQPPHYFPQPPFMPPNVVGHLDNSWMVPPPPPAVPKPSPVLCESFPYNPQPFPWRQNQCDSSQSSGYDNYNYTPYNKKSKFREENYVDYCDVCDRGFKNDEQKRQHYSEHAKCSEPGCKFEAHFKIVEIHKRNLHGNGFNIQLSTPEEIKKWREERRKHYPTEERVKEKLIEAAEKKSSGAVLEERSFGKYGNYRGRGRGRARGRLNNRRGRFSRGRGRYNDDRNNDENNGSIGRDSGGLKRDENFNSSDTVASKTPTSIPDNSALTSLAQLVSNYDSDENNDEVKDKQSKDLQTNRETDDNANDFVQRHPKRVKYNENRANRHFQSNLSKPSLLRMLLEPEIRSERNSILQCVRYIVDNNFFEATSMNSSAQS